MIIQGNLDEIKSIINDDNVNVLASLACLHGQQEIYDYIASNYNIDIVQCKTFNKVGGNKVTLLSYDENELYKKIEEGDIDYVKSIHIIHNYNMAAATACLHGHQVIYDHLCDHYKVDYEFCCAYNNMAGRKVILRRL